MALTLAARIIADAKNYGWNVKREDVPTVAGQSKDRPTAVYVLKRGDVIERIPVVDAVRDGDGFRFVRGAKRDGTGSTGEMIEIASRVTTPAPETAPATKRAPRAKKTDAAAS